MKCRIVGFVSSVSARGAPAVALRPKRRRRRSLGIVAHVIASAYYWGLWTPEGVPCLLPGVSGTRGNEAAQATELTEPTIRPLGVAGVVAGCWLRGWAESTARGGMDGCEYWCWQFNPAPRTKRPLSLELLVRVGIAAKASLAQAADGDHLAVCQLEPKHIEIDRLARGRGRLWDRDRVALDVPAKDGLGG